MEKYAFAVLMAAVSAEVAPVALFHGVDDSCKSTGPWINLIEEGIDYAAPVKCVEIGDGRVSSIFERMQW
jgi:hypothetical protein